MLLPTLIAFGIGLALILVSSRAFLSVTQELAAKWQFSPLFISLVIVAFGTTLPEFAVTITSLYKNDTGLAMGNIIGSCITNITLIFGVSSLFGTVRVGTHKSQKMAVILLATAVLFAMLRLSSISPLNAALLLFFILIFTRLYQYVVAKNGRLHEDKKFLSSIKNLFVKKRKHPKLYYAVMLITSVSALALGGVITVNAVEKLSTLLGFSTTILGLTLTAVSTSLPELTMAMLASHKHENKVVLGTLIGSNLYNLTLFPAIILFFKNWGFTTSWELFSLLIITIFFTLVVFIYAGKTIPKKISIALILFYVIFTLKTLGM